MPPTPSCLCPDRPKTREASQPGWRQLTRVPDVTPDEPFVPVLSPQSFLETLAVGEALRRLDDGLGAREPFLLVTGDPGTGKTALANRAIARWGPRITSAKLALPLRTGIELLEEILRGFGVEPRDGASRAKLVTGFDGTLAKIAARGQVAVIVVDDAHQLSPELLEELRLLVCAAQQAGNPLEVLLLGLPALEGTLDDPALAALRQRVAVRAQLAPLSAGETRRYIRHRVASAGNGTNLFPRRTCVEIAAQARGVPRQINVLAAAALRLARASGGPTVEPDHVHAAVVALSGILPKDEGEDPGEGEVVPSPVPAPRAARRGSTPAVAPALAASPSTARDDACTPSVPPVSTSQDPREWVARFVGEQGPLQISSRAIAQASCAPDEFEAEDAHPGGPTPPPQPGWVQGAPPRPRPRRGSTRQAMTAALVTIAMIAGVAVTMRATEKVRGRAAEAGVVATSASAVQQSERPSGSRAPAPMARTHHAAPAPPGSATAVALPPPRGPHTIDTGAHLDLQSAIEERQRLQVLTGIQGWVAPVDGSGFEKYRVVLGIFRSYARARAAASMLVRSHTLPSADVVPLPPQGTRQ